jgi:proline iminopeptidase
MAKTYAKDSAQARTPLYPEIAPYKTGMMKTPDGHAIYWERSGNPRGIPAVFLHGGPGSGTSPWQRQLFDPKKYDIILFDQRGAGQSTPHASLKNNTTKHLVADMEALRQTLGVGKWLVCGGSWGSTLALAYAEKHAKNIRALAMWGIYLSRESELKYLYYPGGTVSQIFPEVFGEFISLLSQADRKNPIKGYRKLFLSKNAALRHKALDRWTRLESKVVRLVVRDEDLNKSMSNPAYVLAHSLMENHYWLNRSFIDGDRMLKVLGVKLKGIPVHIAHGRYDMVTPFITAWELHKAVKHSKLHVLEACGHAGNDPVMQAKLVEILDGL